MRPLSKNSKGKWKCSVNWHKFTWFEIPPSARFFFIGFQAYCVKNSNNIFPFLHIVYAATTFSQFLNNHHVFISYGGWFLLWKRFWSMSKSEQKAIVHSVRHVYLRWWCWNEFIEKLSYQVKRIEMMDVLNCFCEHNDLVIKV